MRDAAILAHPRLNGTDKLVYVLMLELNNVKAVADTIGKPARVVYRALKRIKDLAEDGGETETNRDQLGQIGTDKYGPIETNRDQLGTNRDQKSDPITRARLPYKDLSKDKSTTAIEHQPLATDTIPFPAPEPNSEDEDFKVEVEGLWMDGIGQDSPVPWKTIAAWQTKYPDALIIDTLRDLFLRGAVAHTNPVGVTFKALEDRLITWKAQPDAPAPGFASMAGFGQ